MFALKVRSIRIQKNLSLREMSDKLHIEYSDYIELETGAREPKVSDIEAYLSTFPDLRLQDLMTVHTFDSAPLESVVRLKMNEIAQHYYSMSSEMEKFTLFVLWLKREMGVDDQTLASYIPVIKKLKNIPIDILDSLSEDENRAFHSVVRTVLRGMED